MDTTAKRPSTDADQAELERSYAERLVHRFGMALDPATRSASPRPTASHPPRRGRPAHRGSGRLYEAAGLRRELAAAEPDYFTDGSLDQSRSSEWASQSSHSLDDPHSGAAC